MSKLRIRPFDINTMPSDAVVLLIGKRSTGKSTMLKDIMFHMRHKLDVGVVMCPTVDPTDSSNGYQSFIPRTLINDSFKSQVIARMLKSQERYITKHGKEKAKNVFIIMDDCMYDKSVMKCKEVRQVAMNGRHRRVFFINAIQYMMDIGPDLRTNIDYIFALKENIISNREKLWKFFFGMFEKYQDFSSTMDTLTSDYGAMVLDNRVNSTVLEDCVFWYSCDPNKSKGFKLCKPIYWKLDDMFYQNKSADQDYSTFKNKRSAVSDIVDSNRLTIEKLKKQ